MLLLDEPFLGLAPIVIDNMFRTNKCLNRKLGLIILVFEQNATLVFDMCDRFYMLETYQICMEGRRKDLLLDECVPES